LLTVIAISTAALLYNRAWTTLQGAEWGTRERNWITGQVRECHRSGCKYQVRVKCTEVELAQDREERAKPGLIKLTMCGDGGYRYEDRWCRSRVENGGKYGSLTRRRARNFVAPPRNSALEGRWRHPYFRPY